MEQMIYQKKRSYEKTKNSLQKLGAEFQEVRTSTAKYLVSNAGKKKMKVYLSDNPRRANACALKNHELGLIGQVKREMKKNYYSNDKGWLLDRVDSKMYVGVVFDLGEELSSDDIVEIDVNTAFQKAAYNLGLLSKKTFDRFFEVEDKPSQVMRKKGLLAKYGDSSYFSGGQCLKYSKKCRLISSGSLASKKHITEYKGFDIVREYTEYNREEANLFFASGYEVGKMMFDIAREVEGVYFWWVDAIFCKKSSASKVMEMMKGKGYDCKVKKKLAIEFDRSTNRVEVVDESGESKPYFFSYAVTLQKHIEILETEEEAKAMLDKYKEFIELKEQDQAKVRARFLKKVGKDIEQAIMDDICKSFDIVSPNDMNTKWLAHQLKIRGLSVQDFIRVKSITMNVFRESSLDHIFGVKEFADLVTLEVVTKSFDVKKEYTTGLLEEEYVNHKQLGRSLVKRYKHEMLNLSFIDNSLIALDGVKIGPKTKIVHIN
jgi:hypothetical protein